MKSLFAPFIALCLILAGVCVCFPECGATTDLRSWNYEDIEITAGFAPLNFDYEVTMPAPVAYKDTGDDYRDMIAYTPTLDSFNQENVAPRNGGGIYIPM